MAVPTTEYIYCNCQLRSQLHCVSGDVVAFLGGVQECVTLFGMCVTSRGWCLRVCVVYDMSQQNVRDLRECYCHFNLFP